LGGVDPVILIAFVVLASILGVVILIFLRDVNSRRDKGWDNDYWDDLDDEVDEESEVDEDAVQASNIAAKAAEYDQIYSGGSASVIIESTTEPATQASPYEQAEQHASSAPGGISSPEGTGGAVEGDKDWVQDGNGHWWKKNEEGFWWRLGEDGQWHSADDSGYA
jgi:hypothetical protein